MISPLQICAAIIVLLSAASAAAEPATVKSTLNLRSGAGTDAAIIDRIPAGSLVDASNCREWCAVDWQGKKGFVIAASLERRGRAPARRTAQKRDPFATDIDAKNNVPMSAGTYHAPDRYYGPYFWTRGPDYGPYKGVSGLGYRGRF